MILSNKCLFPIEYAGGIKLMCFYFFEQNDCRFHQRLILETNLLLTSERIMKIHKKNSLKMKPVSE